jgi:hypothetical protein
MRWWRHTILAVGAALVIAVFASAPRAAAQALGEQITSFRSDVVVGSDGVVTVTETIAYDFGSNERHGIIRVIPTRFSYDDVKKGYDRVTPSTSCPCPRRPALLRSTRSARTATTRPSG